MGFLLLGCLSYSDKNKPIREAVYGGDLPRAFALLEQADHLSPEGKNRLLYHLEKATLLHYLGQYSKAESSYHTASSVMEKLYTQSLTQGALSFVINDSTMDYAGEAYEMIALHTMLALLYLQQNQLSKARVQARRINTKLKELSRDQTSEQKEGYHRDAFALYLSGAIFESLGEYDSAAVDYGRAYESYQLGYPGVGVPKSLVQSLYLASLEAQRTSRASKLKQKHPTVKKEPLSGLWVVAKGDVVVPKISKDFVFAASARTFIRYSWPSIPKISSPLPRYDLRLQNKKYSLEVAQDMDAIARWMLEDQRLSLTLKNITRLTAKEYLTDQLMEANPLLGFFTKIAAAFTETADTRSWSLLPGKFAVQRVPLTPGSYVLSYFVRGGRRQSQRVEIKNSKHLKIVVLDDVYDPDQKLALSDESGGHDLALLVQKLRAKAY